MTTKVDQKAATHEAILQSAAQLVRERGIAGVPVAAVMKGAGLTVGGFYAHFAGKAELIDAALRRTGCELRRRLFTRIEEKPAADRAEVILKRYLSPAHRDLQTEGCTLPAIVGEVATTAPGHATVLREQVEAFAAELEGHLPASRPVSRRHLALGLVALMYGGLSLSRALKGSELSNEVLKACRALGAFAARSDERRSS
jgi:TetR/AcrR family transcriptional regulator, transcriptional repressor for nem operon